MVTVRVYEELNDHLAPERRKRAFEVAARPGTTVRELLASLGVPVGEVDLVLVAGRVAGLDDPLEEGDRLAAYPVFEAFDLGALAPIAGRPLRQPSFFADEHLARLARYLRLAGFDTRLAPGWDDARLVAASEAEGRILLTKDRHLVTFLRPSRVFVPGSGRPAEQFVELVRRLQLEAAARPFTRCIVCNARLRPARREELAGRVPARVRAAHEQFLACEDCGRIYWPGSHHRRMSRLLAAAGITAAVLARSRPPA